MVVCLDPPKLKKKRQNFTVGLSVGILCFVARKALVNALWVNLGNKTKQFGEKYLSEN